MSEWVTINQKYKVTEKDFKDLGYDIYKLTNQEIKNVYDKYSFFHSKYNRPGVLVEIYQGPNINTIDLYKNKTYKYLIGDITHIGIITDFGDGVVCDDSVFVLRVKELDIDWN